MPLSVRSEVGSQEEGRLTQWVGVLLLAALYVVSRYNFLLFHTLAELFVVVVAYSVFSLAWNARRVIDNNYLLFLGIAFPFIGLLHLIHALAYKGMGVFHGYDPYIATQVWIVVRFLLAFVFLIAPAFLNRRLDLNILFACWVAVTSVSLLMLFAWDLFPAMFVEGEGLTPFKRQCEYVISLTLLASLVPLYRKRAHFDPKVFRIMTAAVLAALAAELPFTLYSHVFDSINALGHLLNIVCFYLVYQALVVTGLQYPHELLFRNLKQREEALRESEARLKLALEAGGLATFDWVLAGNRVEWSEAHYRLLGYRPGEIEPAIEVFRDRTHPQDRERQAVAVAEAMRLRSEYLCEFRVVWPDGSVHWLEGRGRFVYDAAGEPMRMFGVLSDITLRKELETERQNLLEAERAARYEAERLNRMKDEFLATVSHELRSPLNAILGWARLLGNGQVDAGKAVGIITRSAGALSQIVEDLLDMSRIVSGKIRLEHKRVDLLETVANVSESVQFTAHAKSIHLEVSFDPDLTPFDCDPGRIQQIVWNLLTNAVKFTPEGGRVLVAVSQSRTHVAIKVQDTGAGIDPGFLPHIFERFRQQDGGVARHHGGLGLGLAIVKNLVELHGGTIEAHSEGLGRGATFTVLLPRIATAQQGDSPGPTIAPACSKPPVSLDEHTLAGIKVLGVDDEAYNRELLGRILAEAGATVRTAASAAEAMAILDEFRPDVLVSDVGMPGEDGFRFIRRLRAGDGWKSSLPCVAVTALSRSEDRERALAVGFNEHVGKPFDPGALCLLISEMAGRGPVPATVASPAAPVQPAPNGRPHVLLAEDDACIAEMLKTVLEIEGYRVSVAATTAQAVRLAETEHVDALVSDLALVDGTGWDLMEHLRSTQPVPGIAVSGYGDPEYVDRSRAAGFCEHMLKPVDVDELVAALGRVLGRTSK